jgi:PII-like signaling protein
MRGEGKRLKIYISERDDYKGEALYKFLLKKFREFEVGGATIISGIEGYGLGSCIKQFNVWDLKEDLPIIIEVVDKAEKIDALIPVVEEYVEGGLITVEDVQIVKYSSRRK